MTSPALSRANSWPPAARSCDRDCAGDAFLDHDLVELEVVLHRVALDLAALDVQALALVGLARGRDPAISENAHFPRPLA